MGKFHHRRGGRQREAEGNDGAQDSCAAARRVRGGCERAVTVRAGGGGRAAGRRRAGRGRRMEWFWCRVGLWIGQGAAGRHLRRRPGPVLTSIQALSTRPSLATGSWWPRATTRPRRARRPAAAPDTPAGVLITTPDLHLRGMDRNSVIVDGTKPGSAPAAPTRPTRTSDRSCSRAGAGPQRDHGLEGRQRVGAEPDRLQLPWRARGRHRQRDLVERGSQQRQGAAAWATRLYLTATSDLLRRRGDRRPVRHLLQQLERRHLGPDLRQQLQRLRLLHRRLPAGVQPDGQPRMGRVQRPRVLGLQLGRQPGRRPNSQFDNNEDGFDTNSQNGDNPPPQNGACPNDGISPITHTHSCWVFMDNYVADNNNPDVPTAGSAAAGPVGTGMSLSGGAQRHHHRQLLRRQRRLGDDPGAVPRLGGAVHRRAPSPRSPACSTSTADAVIGNTYDAQRVLREPDQRRHRRGEPRARRRPTASAATSRWVAVRR